MSFAQVFMLVWGGLAVCWGLFLVVRRDWMAELARALKQQSGMRIALGSQSPRWMVAGGILFMAAGAAALAVLGIGIVH